MKYLKTFESFSPINEEEEFFKTLGQKVASAFGVYNEETRKKAEEIMADYVSEEPLGPDATQDKKTDYILKRNPQVMATRKKLVDEFNAFKKAYDSKSGLKNIALFVDGKVDAADLDAFQVKQMFEDMCKLIKSEERATAYNFSKDGQEKGFKVVPNLTKSTFRTGWTG
jgi:hypothetical protein